MCIRDRVNSKGAYYNCQKNICEYISKKLQTGWGVDTIPDQWRKTEKGSRELIPEWELPLYQIYSPVDRRIWGDVMRISRIPNTWNPKRKRFCIPMTKKMLDKATPQKLNEISKKQFFAPIDKLYMGSVLFKVPTEWDIKVVDTMMCDYTNDIDIDTDPEVTKTILKGMRLPFCIKKCLSITTLDYNLRFWVAVYFREKGFTETQINQIFAEFLRPDYANHAVREERQVWRVFYGPQQKAYFPNCFKFSAMVGCKNHCKECHRFRNGHPVYLPQV